MRIGWLGFGHWRWGCWCCHGRSIQEKRDRPLRVPTVTSEDIDQLLSRDSRAKDISSLLKK
jgi:hypothetical protein